MSDLTLIYYTANRLNPRMAEAVLRELRRSCPEAPVVVVSQNGRGVASPIREILKPVAWIDVAGDPSIAQVYRNILAGCRVATTTYCASAEDDCLYVPEHWQYRPALDTFAYNERRAVLTRRLSADGARREAYFFENPRTQMGMGIYPRALMIETLTERFAAHPNPPLDTNLAKRAGWGEPGRYENNLGVTRRKLTRFPWTAQPNVTINHGGLMGRRACRPDMVQYATVEPWGEADALWRRICG